MRSLLALLVVVGCAKHEPSVDAGNACLNETRADTFVIGLDKPGVGGKLDFQLMSFMPAPPARGDNTWIVQVNTMSAGVVGGPVSGASLNAVPYMPDHGHGTAIQVNITPMPAAGQYQLAPINMWMPGYWETTIHASNGTASDSAVFKACIPN
jgi:hypothetical protein